MVESSDSPVLGTLQRLKKKFEILTHTALSNKYQNPAEYQTYVKNLGREILAQQIADLFKKHIPTRQPNTLPRILDLAAGTGLISSALEKNGYEIVAADINESMLQLLRDQHPRIKTVQADFNTRLPFNDQEFNGVTEVWGEQIHHARRPAILFE